MTVALLLTHGARDEPTATALRLAERLLARGRRVTVFAHEDAVTLTARGSDAADAVTALLRAGVHGGTLDWVIDAEAAKRLGCADDQVSGVVHGDHADLWTFVREADVVLSPGGT